MSQFKSIRSIRKALRLLGYPSGDQRNDLESIQKFQSDYNRYFDNKFEVTGTIDDTRVALESLFKRIGSRCENSSVDEVWKSMCHDPIESGYDEKTAIDSSLMNESNFIEVTNDGIAKLKNIHNDESLRCRILNFEKHGNVLFAIALIPPQEKLPNGRSAPISCPCIFRETKL